MRTRVQAWSKQALPLLTTLLVGASGLSLVVLPRLLDPSGIPEPLEIARLVEADIRAPRQLDIIDAETTDWMQKEAQQAVRSVYDHDASLGSGIDDRIGEAFAMMRAPHSDGSPPREATFEERRGEFYRLFGTALDAEDFADLRARRFDTEVEAQVKESVRAAYRAYVVSDRELLLGDREKGITVRHLNDGDEEVLTEVASVHDLRAARTDMAARLREIKGLSRNQRRLLLSVADRLLKPNLSYNRAESERRRLLAASEVKALIIPVVQGERIASKGDRLTRRQVLILKGFLTQAQKTRSSGRGIGTVALLAIFALATLRFSRSLSKRPLSVADGLFAIAVLVVQMLMVRGLSFALSLWEPSSRIPYEAFLWAAPFAAGALCVRLFLAHEVGLVVGMVSAVAASVMFDGNLMLLLYVQSGALVAATPTRQRNLWWQIGLEVALAQALVIISHLVLDERAFPGDFIWVLPAALCSGLASAIICAVASPFLESVFGFTTERRLQELASLNHPLLKQLIVAAPGTYHHSIVMGQLAEAAATAIGANPWLAKVGAHFHDIGKLEAPRVFDENRRGKGSGLLSDDEWRSVRAHVVQGVRLGRQHRLGSAVIEIIASHHGKAQLSRASLALRYDGPRPVSREAAIVMLADAVEARTREQSFDSPRLLDAVISEVCDEIVHAGELDDCELALVDLAETKQVFARVLATIRRAGDGKRLWLAHEAKDDDAASHPQSQRPEHDRETSSE